MRQELIKTWKNCRELLVSWSVKNEPVLKIEIEIQGNKGK